MTTTTQLRDWWSPACTGPFSRFELYGSGVVSVRPDILPAVAALNALLAAHDYRTRAEDTGAYNCRPITGGTNYSLHAYGIALDLNWSTNPYGPVLQTDMPAEMVADIKAIRTRSGEQVWRWGGDYAGNKDAMHFEICCSPAALSTGIASPAAPTDTPTTPPEDDMPQPSLCMDPRVPYLPWLLGADGVTRVPITKTAAFNQLVAVYGQPSNWPADNPDLFDTYVDISNVNLDAEDLGAIKAAVKAALREGTG